jgi:hypothetical protein
MTSIQTMTADIVTNFVGVDDGRIIRAFGQEAHVLVSSEETGDAFCVLRVFASASNVTPPHLHRTTVSPGQSRLPPPITKRVRMKRHNYSFQALKICEHI